MLAGPGASGWATVTDSEVQNRTEFLMCDEMCGSSTTAEVLIGLPVEQALAESEKKDCPAYADLFIESAKEAEEAGERKVATAWGLLADLCQVALRPGEPNEPFRPMWEEPGGRTLVPGDMDGESAAAVRQLGLAANDGELRARLLDISWECLRDPEAAREAVKGYLDAADALFDPEHWTEYAARVERAARLARQLGDRKLVDEVIGKIEARVIELDGADPLFLSCRLMELLQEFDRGDPESMRDIAAKGARLAEGRGDFERERTYHDLVGGWSRRAGDDQGERGARIAVAASLRRQGEQCSSRGEELVATHWLEKAHETYRNIPGMRKKANEVYAQLRESQRLAATAIGRLTTEIQSATELIKHARACVAGKPLREALLGLATVVQVTDFDHETQNARELMGRFPLQGLFGGVTMDRTGRVVARRRPAFTTDEKEFDLALWERVVQHVDLRYQLIAQTGIVPAMKQLNFEHSLALEDMVDVVVDNPFVPPGHEELFARGFLAGFRWNLAEGLSILVPQLESLLRHVLSQGGHEVTKRDKHGLQNFIQMGVMLSERRADLEGILGKDMVQELRVLFVDQHGVDLRNQIAHGLMQYEQFFHHASIYAWWFIFHLTICPVRERFLNEDEAAENATGRSEATG